MGRATPRQEPFDICGYGWQEEGEFTLAWAGAWTGGSLKVIPGHEKKLCADADTASTLTEKKMLVAGAAEGSGWLEPKPNSTHFSPT